MIEIPTFAADVLIEILLRLPVKQVCQLKIVSKQWLLVISGPHFKILYNKRSMRTPRLLVVEKVDKDIDATRGTQSRTLHMSTMDISIGVISREFSKYVSGRHYTFLSASNLFCYNTYGRYNICNPTTHEHVHLPSEEFPSSGFYCGYLQDTNEYKIVIVCRNEPYNDDKFQYRILTLKDGEPMIPSCWRIIENDMPTWSYTIQSVSIKCFIYSLVYSRDSREKSIISIDLKTESFTTIACPEVSPARDHENDGGREQLIEIKGDLCLARLSEEFSTLTVFVLKDLKSNIWAKEYSIDLSNMGERIAVVGCLSCDNNNVEILLCSNNRNLLFYNINDRSFRRLEHTELPERCYVSFYYDRLFSFGG